MTSLTYDEAIKKVKAQVAASRTSFHAGMAVLPKKRREAMYALYAFCRIVDDIADESVSTEMASHELGAWRSRIAHLFKGGADDAVTTALLPAVRSFGLIEKDFQDIIDGMEMDASAIVAPDSTTLDLYCDRVASAVGRISVRIFGASEPEALNVAHHLGRALQLTNILRDLSEDAARGRLYLPRERLEKHGISSRQSDDVLKDPRLPAVCRDLAATAQEHYEKASDFMKLCSPSAIRPARIMKEYYAAILARLLDQGWRDPSVRVALPKWQKLCLILKGFFA